ncbi:MAG: hypothetical protein OXF44_02465 [Anaerolineaceae bacterium]|nr:hypothetical protein [Anaerolineaceae bacterium]
MKARLLSAILALLILCSAAAAQEYQIRTDARINLRTTFSLEGAIVETVPTGTVLQVVGRFNRWLTINRNGNTLWMADWVPYTRVGDGGQTQSQIDNCCFVDRQCRVDADWVSGYWAFQNGQCAAPLQPGLQLPGTSTGSDSSEVDNCCFLDWQCSNDAEWERGYRAFQNDLCDAPASVIIEGPPDFVAKWEEVLRLLERKSPQWYAYAINGLDKIQQIGGMYIQTVRPDTRTFSISRNAVFMPHPNQERSVGDMASMLVHEACHVYRYEAGIRTSAYEEEKACYLTQLEADRIINPRTVWLLESFLETFDDPRHPWNQ